VTEFGPIAIAWTNTPEGITIDCTIPSGVASLLRLYARAGETSIIVDEVRRQAQRTGEFVELPLAPGRRLIAYGHTR
jgi:hypothetical protein